MKNVLFHFRQAKRICGWIIMLIAVGVFSPMLKAQTAYGVKIISSVEVGCEGMQKGFEFEHEIGSMDNPCEKVCRDAVLEYKVINSTASYFIWQVEGGVINSQSGNVCYIRWDNSNTGSLIVYEAAMVNGQISMNGGGSSMLCVEKIPTPIVEVQQFGNPDPKSLSACVKENVLLLGVEISNDVEIKYWHWDFGDGTSSTEQNPTHQWTNSGSYPVTLTVRTACNCEFIFESKIDVKPEKFNEITCASVVCENQVSKYTTTAQCSPYNWIVQGGSIVTNNGPDIEVVWDNVSDDGFGLVMLDNMPCKDGSKCSPFTSIEIPVIKVEGKIKGKTAACVGEELTYTLPKWPATVYHWEVDPAFAYAYSFSHSNEQEFTIQFSQAGTVRLRASYENTLIGCKGSAFLDIQVDVKPVIKGVENACQGNAHKYQSIKNNVAQYTNWTVKRPNGVIDYIQGLYTLNYTFSDAGVYTITADDGAACPPDAFKVNVHKKPPTPVIKGDIAACLQTLTLYSVPKNNAYTYKWEVTNGTPTTAYSDEILVKWTSYTASTGLKVTYTDREEPYCQSSPATIAVKPLPQIAATIKQVPPDSVFENCTRRYVASYAYGETYEWSIIPATAGSVVSGTRDTVDIRWNEINPPSLTATVQLVIRKCEGLQSLTLTCSVLIYDIPNLTIIPSTATVCAGAPAVQFQSNHLSKWYVDGVLQQGPASYAFNYTPVNVTNGAVDRLITAEATVRCNVVRMGYASVTVNPAPRIAIKNVEDPSLWLCIGQPLNVHLQMTNDNNVPIGSIKWGKDGSFITPSATINPYLATVQGDYFVEATGLNGCKTTSSVFRLYQKVCVPGSGTLPPSEYYCLPDLAYSRRCDAANNLVYTFVDNTATSPGYGSYTVTWKLSGGGYGNTTVGSGSKISMTLTPNTTYTMRIVINNSSTLYRDVTFTATKDAKALYTTSPALNVCAGNQVTFTPTPPSPVQTYLWKLGQSKIQTTQIAQASFTYVGAFYLTIRDTLITTDLLSCKDTYISSINVYPNLLRGRVDCPPTEVCEGTDVPLTYVRQLGDPTPLSYLWQHNQCTTATTTANHAGEYYVTLTGQYGCINTVGVGRPNIVPPTPAVITGKTIVCKGSGETVNLSANTGNPASQYEWFRNGGLVGTGANLTTSAWASGTYTISVNVKTPLPSGTLCTQTASTTLKILDKPEAPKFVFNVLDCDNYLVDLKVTNPKPGTYQWSSGQTGDYIKVYQGGSYRVQYTSPEGCQSESQSLAVPHDPAYYFWTFPKGCYNLCEWPDKYVHGIAGFPTGQTWKWFWFEGGNTQSTGSAPSYSSQGLNPPLRVHSKFNDFQMALDNGYCYKQTEPFYVKWEQCKSCDLKITILNIACVEDPKGVYKFLIDIDFYNPNPFHMDYTLTPRNPAGASMGLLGGGICRLQPGSNTLSFVFDSPVPVPGNVVFDFLGHYENLFYCSQVFETFINKCSDYKPWKKSALQSLESDSPQQEMLSDAGKTISIFPNPARTEVNIAYDLPPFKGEASMEIYDLQGKQKGRWTLSQAQGEFRISVKDWTSGVYMLKLLTQGQVLETRKLVITK